MLFNVLKLYLVLLKYLSSASDLSELKTTLEVLENFSIELDLDTFV